MPYLRYRIFLPLSSPPFLRVKVDASWKEKEENEDERRKWFLDVSGSRGGGGGGGGGEEEGRGMPQKKSYKTALTAAFFPQEGNASFNKNPTKKTFFTAGGTKPHECLSKEYQVLKT